jgi:hypothetical protein
MVLLGICVGALLIGALRLATERTPQPSASSYSTEADGAMALYAWVEAVGARPQRLRDPDIDPGTETLLVLEPETMIDSHARDAFDAVPGGGGTLVLAGDSISWVLYARELGVDVQPVAPQTSSVTSPDGLRFLFSSRYTLRAPNAQPLLVRDNGEQVALRIPYRQGTLIAIASSEPLSNARLKDDATARFVFRQIVSPAMGQSIGFDEIHHANALAAPGPPTFNSLLFQTPAGRAVIYAAVLTFLYLLLTGRRLGPALEPRAASESQRTMYEHVQMLANLYRRAGQLAVVRDAFSRHYSRRLTPAGSGSGRAAITVEALARVQAARTESDLIAAVAAVDDAG